MTTPAERALRYDREHARSLRALAYRMLGSRAEAEDIVQDAWLRWARVDESAVQHAGAYLSRLVTNLCLDRLRSAAAKREQDVGVWLPEPLLDEEAGWAPGPEAQAEFAQDVSVAFMLALERLSPLERAAFLLHEVFDLDFYEIGRRLQRSPAACRQLASRARNHVKADYARREVEQEERERLFAKTFIGFATLPTSRAWRFESARINGLPGCLVFDDATGQLVQTIALAPSATEPGRIGALYIQRNPDKLQGVRAALGGDVTTREAGSS